MPQHFTRKTFDYFDGAHKNSKSLKWFEKNRGLYEEHVQEPFSHFLTTLNKKIGPDLPFIAVKPSCLTRPLRPKNRADQEGLVKNFAHFTLWEKRTSLFEWNPGIHFQIGAKPDDNFIGLGLYMTSSRQLSLLRASLSEKFDEIDKILSNRKLQRVWGSLAGEKYKRFPKGFSVDSPEAIYLWQKQFYLGQTLSRKKVVEKSFIENCSEDLKIALPFFKWVRSQVGVYKKSSTNFADSQD